MTTQGLTYAKAGVSIEAGDKLVHRIGPIAGKTRMPGVIAGVGGFSALFDLQSRGYRHPILVSSTDGVGTKLKIAFMTGIHDTIGIDLVAMGVNDILTQGAAPLFFSTILSVASSMSISPRRSCAASLRVAAKRAARSSAVKPRSIRAIFPRANTILRGLSSASWRRRK